MKLMEINMSRKKGQTYSAKQKTKIVLELLKEEIALYIASFRFYMVKIISNIFIVQFRQSNCL